MEFYKKKCLLRKLSTTVGNFADVIFVNFILLDHLLKYVEVIRQLLQDVEERLVFRTNIFFQHDLLSYNPSPGDLAYPEKLEQMEVSMFNPVTILLTQLLQNITLELQEVRTDSRASVVSLESQEVASINSSNQFAQFRSYTGSTPHPHENILYYFCSFRFACGFAWNVVPDCQTNARNFIPTVLLFG